MPNRQTDEAKQATEFELEFPSNHSPKNAKPNAKKKNIYFVTYLELLS